MKILIVDDDNDLRETIVEEFRLRKFIVLEAINGKKGLEVLENETVDLVISDVRMPVMDGMNFLKAVKAKDNKKPPVFIMTGGSQYTESELLLAGANAFFDKPLDMEDLIKKAEEFEKTA